MNQNEEPSFKKNQQHSARHDVLIMLPGVVNANIFTFTAFTTTDNIKR